ncbi:hypothetical protein QFC22_006106 [Naganishia vaughanmartiniae]|uniref:Uncharacterized protein n=1 Tax=Naganishia vaughanmartiniae TaxID=1424756 RepID=A0ACC2WPB5_9TREE|nr:hypothetical protein QFC22_006106 [Naganishia vaughanmartiniae]
MTPISLVPLLILLASSLTPSGALPNLANTTIQLESGPARGFQNTYRSEVATWYGVPYGASTAGKNRWRPPQPVEPWNKTRYFDTFGDACPDISLSSLGPGSDSSFSQVSTGTSEYDVSEDCLNVNIWSGANTTHDALPVYVWYHPAYATGNDAMFDGSALADKGLVVVVVNHRQSVMGFLVHPWLTEESDGQGSGNYAMLDNLEVLKWVQKNIRAFGGDPHRVTIGGQSAGSSHTNIMSMSNLTTGLFHGAIIESGIRFPNDTYLAEVAAVYQKLEVAETNGKNYTDSHNITSLAQLRNATLDELFTAYSSVAIPAVNVLDGYVMTKTYWQSLVDGYPNDVPIITGNTHDESGASTGESTTLEAWQQDANGTYGVYGMADEFFALYTANDSATAAAAHNANATDTSVVGDWEFAKYWRANMQSPFYTYFWTHAPPGQSQGAYHESEIYYAFNSLEANTGRNNWTSVDTLIADQMSSYWANFIKHGNPNGVNGTTSTSGNLSYWAPTAEETPESATVFNLDEVCQSVRIASPARIEFLQKYWGYQTDPY